MDYILYFLDQTHEDPNWIRVRISIKDSFYFLIQSPSRSILHHSIIDISTLFFSLYNYKYPQKIPHLIHLLFSLLSLQLQSPTSRTFYSFRYLQGTIFFYHFSSFLLISINTDFWVFWVFVNFCFCEFIFIIDGEQ